MQQAAGLRGVTPRGSPTPRCVCALGCTKQRQLQVSSRSRRAVTLATSGQTSSQGYLNEVSASSPDGEQETLKDVEAKLGSDLRQLFETGAVSHQRFQRDVSLEDPIFKQNSLERYVRGIQLLRLVFNTKFEVLSVTTTGDGELTGKWSLRLSPRLAPWNQNLSITGSSIFKVNPFTGVILSQRNYWDAVSNNEYLSREAIRYVLSLLTQPQLTPELETPDYKLIKKSRDYEVRRYSPFVIAEVNMSPDAGPAGGSGFRELANYIFGSNTSKEKMEMTTPVFTVGEKGQSKMQFVMESRFDTLERLPQPTDGRITRRREDGGLVGACVFTGWPLDFEVADAERRLRQALVAEGLNPLPGYHLARYNEPFVPPFLRRNEIIINLKED